MRVLVLARHAKAEGASPNVSDHARPLMERGKEAAADLGQQLTSAGIEPDVAYVSDAARTVETWVIASQGWDVPVVEVRRDLYATSVGTLISVLQETPPGASIVMVVGHQPIMSVTAVFLAGPGSNRATVEEASVGMATGAAAILEFDGEWGDLGKGSARLRAVMGRAK